MENRSAAAAVLFAAAIQAVCLAGCARMGRGEVSIMSYNVHNLFDGRDSGAEYPEFSVARGDWSDALYRQRLEGLRRTIQSASRGALEGGLPDVIALLEIENLEVARDLAALMPSPAYRAVAAELPGSAISLGAITRLPLATARTHAAASGEADLRPILELELESEAGPLILFVNHWKSKREGAAASEAGRLAQAEALRAVMAERRRERPEAALLACGDFNEDPAAWAAEPPDFRTALSLADGKGRYPSPILVSGGKVALADPGPLSIVLCSPWLMPGNHLAGSYAFRGRWERIDAFLMDGSLLDGRGLEYLAFPAPRLEGLLDQKGFPLAWAPGGPGCSDHLPIILRLAALPCRGGTIQ
jgi:hypothetical protein